MRQERCRSGHHEQEERAVVETRHSKPSEQPSASSGFTRNRDELMRPSRVKLGPYRGEPLGQDHSEGNAGGRGRGADREGDIPGVPCADSMTKVRNPFDPVVTPDLLKVRLLSDNELYLHALPAVTQGVEIEY